MGAVVDWIFPYAEAPSALDLTNRRSYEAEQIQQVDAATDPLALAEAYVALLGEDSDRLRSVEGRLGGLLGLTSLTATLLFSGILAIANGTLGDYPRVVRVVAALCVLYLSAQIVCSTLASIRGLSRTAWIRADIADLMPVTGDHADATNRRKALSACKRYLAGDQTINDKVTQMAVAHTAVRNFAVGSAVISVLGLSMVFTQDRSTALSKAIQKDTQLQHLLQGIPGPPGPTGTAGVCSRFENGINAKPGSAPLLRNKRAKH